MVRQIIPISALLLGLACLLFAGGINSLVLPVRGTAEGFSALSLGLLGTGWAFGYVLGCLYTPQLVGRVGHIRSFGVMAAFAAIAVLASLLMLTPAAWIPLRAISGFCFAGAAMIAESWLSERAQPNTRGRIFGLYTMVSLIASTGGQMTLMADDETGYFFFILAAIFYCLALVPTAISSSASPKPLVSVRLDIRALWKNSPIAVYAVLMVGVSNSAFGTLAAVYGGQVGLSVATIALFASLPILAGAVVQIPVGFLSDRIDRRQVLIAIALVAIFADFSFVTMRPQGETLNIALACVFGAAVFSMYPVIVAHANDHAAPGTNIQTSGGLLMIYGIGAIAGPLVAGFGMSRTGPSGLFYLTLAAHVPIVLFAAWRIFQRAPVAREEKVEFMPAPLARASTPETFAMAVDETLSEEADRVFGALAENGRAAAGYAFDPGAYAEPSSAPDDAGRRAQGAALAGAAAGLGAAARGMAETSDTADEDAGVPEAEAEWQPGDSGAADEELPAAPEAAAGEAWTDARAEAPAAEPVVEAEPAPEPAGETWRTPGAETPSAPEPVSADATAPADWGDEADDLAIEDAPAEPEPAAEAVDAGAAGPDEGSAGEARPAAPVADLAEPETGTPEPGADRWATEPLAAAEGSGEPSLPDVEEFTPAPDFVDDLYPERLFSASADPDEDGEDEEGADGDRRADSDLGRRGKSNDPQDA